MANQANDKPGPFYETLAASRTFIIAAWDALYQTNCSSAAFKA